MPRPCSICVHPDRNEIERVLLELDPSSQVLRPVTERWADISKQALARHRDQGHIVKAIVKAQGIKEAMRGDDLLAQVRNIQDTAHRLLSKAEAAEDLRTALQGIREIRGCIELFAKLAGELKDGVSITINQGADMAILARLIDAGLCSGCRMKIVEMERAVTGEWRTE